MKTLLANDIFLIALIILLMFYCLFFTEFLETTNKEYAVVDDSNAVYHCKHAFVLDHLCTYAICNKCKLKNETEESNLEGYAKRTRSVVRNNTFAKNNDPQGRKHALNTRYITAPVKNHREQLSCHHKRGDYSDLEMYCDASYFEENYLQKMKQNKQSFPYKCCDCGLEFRKI